METIFQAEKTYRNPQITAKPTKSEHWKAILPEMKHDLNKSGIDDDANFAEIASKIATSETISGKGICLLGTVGSGKTTRARFLCDNFANVLYLSASSIGLEWIENDGSDSWLLERIGCVNWLSHAVIDDLGTEEMRYSCYGNSLDVLQRVIEKRYNVFPRWKTHITTNLNQKQLKERYGARIYSRLREMCAFIPLVNRDRRLEK